MPISLGLENESVHILRIADGWIIKINLLASSRQYVINDSQDDATELVEGFAAEFLGNGPP